MGNFFVDDTGEGVISDSLASLSGDYSILGRSIVLHTDADDLGKGTGDSLLTGNSGSRLACGTIYIQPQGVY